MIRVFGLGVYFVLCGCPAFSAVVNVLVNGSFEITGDASSNTYDLRTNTTILNGWTYHPKANQVGVSGVNGFTPTDYSTYPGQFSTPFGDRWVVFGSGSSNPGGELIQTIFLQIGEYRASIWAKGYGFSTEPVKFLFGIAPNYGLGAATLSNGVAGNTATGGQPEFVVWNEYATNFQVDSAGYVNFIISDTTDWGTATNADLFIDNAVLQLIPEPSTSLLFAVGGLIVLARRRKS